MSDGYAHSSTLVGMSGEPVEKRSLRAVPAMLARALRLLWAADHRTFLITAALQVTAGAGVAAQLLVGNKVLRAIIDAGTSKQTITAVLPELAVLAAVTAVLGFAQAAQAGYHRLLAERAIRHFNRLILEVAGSVDLESFESAQFYDRLQRARQQGISTPLQISLGLLGITNSVVSVAGIAVALTAIEPLLLPLVVAGYLPLWVVARRNSEEMYQFSFGQTPGDRLRQHLSQALAGREQAAETRAFGLARFLLDRWDGAYAERIGEIATVVRRHVRRSLLASGMTSVLQAGVFAVLVALLLSGRVDVAGTATAAIAIQQLAARLQRIGDDAAALYESARYLDDFEAFLGLRPSVVGDGAVEPAPPFTALQVDDLRFRYPASDRDVLDGVSFDIKAGEVVALVGENGSGKTTLAKLLAVLYRPTGGRVLWDGVDVRERHPDAWRHNVAVIFQDFVRHRLTASENVGMGDAARMGDLDAIRAATTHAGADAFLASLPDGYDTVLSKEFEGGADLSVGQWQRVALARAFFRDAPFIVLDEPTAALDAKAEYELFETVRDLAGGRTVLLISHRFSSVRSADRILVLHEGRLVEQGTHRELMAASGRYAEMFTLQASAYVEELTP